MPASVIPTTTEESLLDALEMPYWSPEGRAEERIRAYLLKSSKL